MRRRKRSRRRGRKMRRGQGGNSIFRNRFKRRL